MSQYDAGNLPDLRPGYRLAASSTCPIPSGEEGWWMDSSKALHYRHAAGGDTNVESHVPVCIPVILASAISGAVVGRVLPRFAGKVLAIDILSVTPPTTTGKGATFAVLISGSGISGGLLTCTQAGLATLGTRQSGTAITGQNAFTAAQEIQISVSAAAAAFSEGQALLQLFFGAPA